MKKPSFVSAITQMVIIILFYVVLIVLITSDDTVCYWEFEHEPDEVVSIKIVDFENLSEYEVIKELDLSLVNEVYFDVENLEMHYYGWNLAHPGDICFLIEFSNGEADLISCWEPRHLRCEDGKRVDEISWLCSNGEDFDSMINKYLE